MISLQSYLLLGAFLFATGVACMLIRRNIVQMLMGVELVLNGAALNFASFAHFAPTMAPQLALSGQVVAIFVIALAATEAAVALALVLAVGRLFGSVDVTQMKDLRG